MSLFPDIKPDTAGRSDAYCSPAPTTCSDTKPGIQNHLKYIDIDDIDKSVHYTTGFKSLRRERESLRVQAEILDLRDRLLREEEKTRRLLDMCKGVKVVSRREDVRSGISGLGDMVGGLAGSKAEVQSDNDDIIFVRKVEAGSSKEVRTKANTSGWPSTRNHFIGLTLRSSRPTKSRIC
jgi:hypothetical protein